MALTIQVKISKETEAELKRSLESHDQGRVRELLHSALEPVIDEILETNTLRLDSVTWNRLADELIEYVAAKQPADAPPLSDYAVSRESIYED